MGREHAALIRTRWHQEEVEGALGVRLLDQTTVYNAAGRGIAEVATLILHEEALRDALVHDN